MLIADRVVHARHLRDRPRAIAVQAAIVMTQAALTAQTAGATLDGTGDLEAAGDDLRSYGTMLLIAAPLLIHAPLSRTFLEEAQSLAGELARALHALAILSPEQREAVTEDPTTSPTGAAGAQAQLAAAAAAGAAAARRARARSRCPRPGA